MQNSFKNFIRTTLILFIIFMGNILRADNPIFLYDASGALVAIINTTPNSTTHSYVSATGEPLGYVYSDGAVYTYSGTFIGWYTNGILYDKQGHKIAFAKNKQAAANQVIETTSQPVIETPVIETTSQPIIETTP